MAGFDETALQKRVQDYIHKSRVLRQIQSGKLQRTSRWNATLNYTTVVVAALVTFTTFFGVRNVYNLFLTNYIQLDRLEFLFNFLILLLLIASFLQMTLNLGEKSLRHLESIRELTGFLTTLDDMALLKGIAPDVCEFNIERLNDKYKMIISALPANSDKEWRRTKLILEKGKRK